MKIKYQGMRATRKFLYVSAVMEVGTAVRFLEIPIPIRDIQLSTVEGVIDSKVRQDLVSIWSAERGDPSLW